MPPDTLSVAAPANAWHEASRRGGMLTGAADPSIVGRLDRRGWLALSAAGINSVEALAGLDPYCLEDPDCEPTPAVAAVLDVYLPEVTHRRDGRAQLAAVAHRARMIRDGVRLERTTTGPIAVPDADITVDFDIEWDYGNHVYLWGFLRGAGAQAPSYHPVVSWDLLDDGSEAALAAQAWTWLRSQVAAADASQQSLLVWHYSKPEITYWRRIIERTDHPQLPSLDEFDTFVAERFVDLYPYSRDNLRGVAGLGLKSVAVDGAGFHWRDDDPGGQQSQAWHADSLEADDPVSATAARERVLAYNEDDVLATRAVRAWLRAETQANSGRPS